MKPQSGTVSTGLTHLLPANRSRYTATWPLTKVKAQSNKFQGRWFKPHLQVSGYSFNPQLFLFGYGFRPHGVPDESGIRIRNFLNPTSRVEIFEYAMNPDSCRPLIRIFFLIPWRNKIIEPSFFTVDTALKMAISLPRSYPSLRRMLCCQYSHLEESWVTEWIRIRAGYVWAWKFFNPERKSCGFKNMRVRVDGASVSHSPQPLNRGIEDSYIQS